MEDIAKTLKNLFREKINIVILLLITTLVVNCVMFICLSASLTKIRKKIDHRYFNITTTLEEIHQVEVNTYNGELKRVND